MNDRADAPARNDWPTVAAVGLLAMCVVTFDHEALGHGSACLLLHGHIRLLTSSLFRCDVKSGWIDPAGPAANLLMGALALALSRLVPRGRTTLRLFLILVTAFSFLWETGYVMHAMHRREGDLYFFARFLLGDVTLAERWAAGVLGFALYLSAAWLVSDRLSALWPDARVARAVARTAWFGATLGAAVAALAYKVHDWGNLRDAVLEIGAASCPLLFIPLRSAKRAEQRAPLLVARSPAVIGLAVVVYLLFVASLGRGLPV
jgi:hypothetical protein